jgi:hypothetical protein
MIIAFAIFIFHILYKVSKAIRHRRRVHVSEAHQLTERLMEEEIAAETTRRIRGLQVPSRACTRRRSSDVSVLPRYEQHGEDVKGDEDMEVEKRGRYTYPVRWPERRDNVVNASKHWKSGYDDDAVAIDDDVLSPTYHKP